MKVINILLLTVSLILITGCGGDEEDFSRYPSVWVPKYVQADYIRDLSDPDTELVYNATCNLGKQAGQFSKTLCATNAEPASLKYKTAEEVYRRICSQLEAKEPYTVAATLRFLQYFAKEYKPKEELIELVSKIESNHPQVQFEQVTLLRSLVSKSSQLPEPLLRRLLDSPSWIVSRSTYGLISRLSDEPLRQELVHRYQSTDDEKERLIIITALKHRLEPEEARLFEKEMLATDNPKIRSATGMALMNNVHCPGVKPWLKEHYTQLSNREKKWLVEKCDDDDLSLWFLSQGYVPEDKFLEQLAEASLSDDEEARTELLRFEEAIQANQELAGRWDTMKNEAKHAAEQRKALQKDMAPVVAEFIDTTTELLAKHELSDADQEKLLKQLNKNMNLLIGSK